MSSLDEMDGRDERDKGLGRAEDPAAEWNSSLREPSRIATAIKVLVMSMHKSTTSGAKPNGVRRSAPMRTCCLMRSNPPGRVVLDGNQFVRNANHSDVTNRGRNLDVVHCRGGRARS